jgi:hypothetical protein
MQSEQIPMYPLVEYPPGDFSSIFKKKIEYRKGKKDARHKGELLVDRYIPLDSDYIGGLVMASNDR